MLDGKAPPKALAKGGKLPKALTLAANPQWKSPSGRERFAFDYLRRALGLSSIAAAALVGNIAVESRYNGVDLVPGRWQPGFPPSAHTLTSTNVGFGIGMWTYPARKEALKDFAGAYWGNFAMELAFVAHELKYPEEVVRGRDVFLVPRDTLDKLKNAGKAGNIQEATAIVMAVYEHPDAYREVPRNFASVNHLLAEFNFKPAIGPNANDKGGYYARLDVAKKIRKTYG